MLMYRRGCTFYEEKNIINLIRCYTEKNDEGFRNESYEIARDFDESGDHQLAEYIMSLLSNVNTFVPQMEGHESTFLKELKQKKIFYCYLIQSCKIF